MKSFMGGALRLVLLAAVMGVLLTRTTASFGADAAVQRCDRLCLAGVLRKYLEGLTARDPVRAGLTSGVRETENGLIIQPGEGQWKTATGLGHYRIRLLDPETQTAGYFGVLREGPRSSVFFVRLKAPAGHIAEVETLIARTVPPAFAAAAASLTTARSAFSQPVANKGVARADLIATANSYYEGIEHGRGDVTAFAPDCHRIENGVPLVNNPHAPFDFVSPTGRQLPNFGAMGCRAQFDTGIWGTDAIAGRRFPLVDERTGVVAAFTIYRSHAKSRCAEVRGYGQVCPTGPARVDLDLVELFKVRDGLIHEMESVWTVIPIDQGSGW